MSAVAQRPPKTGGLLTSALEIILSIGGYYLLRALAVDVFWALTAPAIAVAVVAVVVTVHRRRIDMIGLLVLCEIATTITLSLATHSPRIAALREPAYLIVAGVFCLITLVHRTPLAHTSTMSIATFGDPRPRTRLRARVARGPRIPPVATTAHGLTRPDPGHREHRQGVCRPFGARQRDRTRRQRQQHHHVRDDRGPGRRERGTHPTPQKDHRTTAQTAVSDSIRVGRQAIRSAAGH